MLTNHSPTTEPTADHRSNPIADWFSLAVGVVAAALVLAVDRPTGATLALPLIGAGILAAGDQRTGRIPNRHSGLVFAATILATAASFFGFDHGSISGAFAGAAMWAVPLFVMAVIGSFGGGDFKLAASLGAMCGWISIPTAVIGLVVALAACCVAGLIEAKRAGTMNASVRLGLPLFVGTVATIVGAVL
jgi:prepilin signal peptidase PulO-like enzyme (type II secretory pathway)